MKIVFSVGGSILAPFGVDENFLFKLKDFLIELSDENDLAVVVGGGKPARDDIKVAREKGATWAQCDHIGVLATRRNAMALLNVLGDAASPKMPESIHEAGKLFGNGILVMGGTEPGHSTDAVACLLGDWVGADLFVNASNVDAVYDKNPGEFPDALPLKEVSIYELEKILAGGGSNAGEYPLLDHVALKVLARSGIKTLMVNGRDIENMRKAVLGGIFRGTIVHP